MKKFTLGILISLIGTLSLFAQVPQAFKYQTVVRDNTGNVMVNQNVSFRMSILQGSITGPSMYTEMHLLATNEQGLVNLEIGNGILLTGDFSAIDWGGDAYFLKVEMDPNGLTNYQLMGTTQLLAVPYAMYSEATGDTTRWRKNGNNLYYLNGNVGIGTYQPGSKLDIHGGTRFTVRLDNASRSKVGNLYSSDDTLALVSFGSAEISIDENNNCVGKSFRIVHNGNEELLRVQEDGKVGIGTSSPNPSAILEVSSTSKGILPPRMSESERNSIASPTAGLLVYQTTAPAGYYYYNGTNWIGITGTGSGAISASACIDYDGNAYPTFTIGNQVWMAENLRVTHYRNGSAIPNVTDGGAWSGLSSGAYCWYGNDQNTNGKFGALYNWYAVDDNRGLCPNGWHVPTDTEWTTLTTYLGGTAVAGGKMKSTSDLWSTPNEDATNNSNFSGLPGGSRYDDGTFYDVGSLGGWWSSTEYSSTNAWYRFLYYSLGSVFVDYFYSKQVGRSVRCLRD